MADPTQEQTQEQAQEQTQPQAASKEAKSVETQPAIEDMTKLVAEQVNDRLSKVSEQFKGQLKERDNKIATLIEEAEAGAKELSSYKDLMKRVKDAFVGNEPALTPGEAYEKEISPPEGITDPDFIETYKGLQRQRLQYESALNNLAEELETAKASLNEVQTAHEKDIEARKQADEARQQAERVRFLARLAVEQDAVDPLVVERMFGPCLEFQNGVLMYRNSKGELVDAETGVKAEFPAYLKKPRGPAVGGSGSQGHVNQPAPLLADGMGGTRPANKEALEKRLETLQESIKNGRSDQLADYWAIERQLKEMTEAEQAA